MVVHELGDLLKLGRAARACGPPGYAAAIAGQQLDGFVEAGRVRAIGRVERIVFRRDGGGAGIHARAIAPHGVDFAVVREHAQGLGAAPRGLGVGGVALMEDGEGGFVCGIGEIGIVLREQAAGAERLVDDR